MTRVCRRARVWPDRWGMASRSGMAVLAGVLCLVVVWCLVLETTCLAAGIPEAVWQDNDRNHRRSPSQIKRQLRSPEVRAARLPLAETGRVGNGAEDASLAGEQAARAARVRSQIAQAPAPPAEAADLQIPPMILITFVENAFKYGSSSQEDCTIFIKLKTDGRRLDFETVNSIIRTRSADRSPIGIENCRKRLQLLYGKEAVLDVENDEAGRLFKVRLVINM